MRFKISLAREPKHTGVVSAVGWVTGDEVLSCADDHMLLKWNILNGESTNAATLPDTLFPTDIHWFPRGLGGGSRKGGGGSDLFVLTSTDGKYYMISKGGRVEKTVEAHKGAVLSARWSFDGASLLTVGEDGAVKVWSRSGMLRSTMSQNSSPVYAGGWSPDNTQIVYCNGYSLTIKPLQPNAKPTTWVAHEGVVLSLDWNPCNGLIVSGGEDNKYKVWDGFGRALFSSVTHEFPITSVSWSVNGELFAVGSFNTLRLCDKIGWSHSLEKPRTGSVFNIQWSPDGTQIAGACGNGHVIFANVIERRVEWRNLEALQSKRKTVEVRDVGQESRERLELRDRVTTLALTHQHLVIATSAQCYVYNSKNWNTPTIFDLKEGCVSLILLSTKVMLLVDGGSVIVYGYDGRQQCSIKFPGMRTEVLNERTVGVCNDSVAIKDKTDDKTIHVFDTSTGKPLGDGKVTHTQGILELSIDQCGSSSERRIAFVDKNNDLFLTTLKSFGSGLRVVKLGVMIHNIKFNDMTNMLVGLQDTKLIVWPYPSVAYVDKELLSRTIIEKLIQDVNKAPQLVSFVGNSVTVRRVDGSVITTGISPFPSALHAYVDKNKWDQALRLCRHVKDESLWGTLAGMAAYARNLNTAEIAYSAINEAEKVKFLTEIRGTENKDIRNAQLALYCGNVHDAEGVLLQSGHIFRAILMNITLYRWDRALELAAKHKIHVDTVLGYRQKYLEEFGRTENIKAFIQYEKEVEVDWDHIEERIQAELRKEKSK